MLVEFLKVRNVRVIEELDLEPGAGVNLIVGGNGAGKTSLIEALYIAGRGQSFRHREVRPWIREGSNTAQIFAQTRAMDGMRHRVGVEQARNGRRVRIDGKDLLRRSDLVRVLPLQLLTPASHELIEKGPGVRRRFVDWGLFHVEPRFHEQAIKYRKLLHQRNAALRSGDTSFSAWDGQLAAAGDAIEAWRTEFIPAVNEAARLELAALQLPQELVLELGSNWDRGRGLQEQLRERRSADRNQGHTTLGPHRSALDVRMDGVAAERRLSRGQQKLLVYALVFGLLRLIRARTGESTVLLVDDLPAELDRNNRLLTMRRLADLGVQAFVSGIDFDEEIAMSSVTMFHVEHGRLANVQRQEA